MTSMLNQLIKIFLSGKIYNIFFWSFSFIVFFYLGDNINEKMLRDLVLYTSTLSIVINADILGANNSVIKRSIISRFIKIKYFFVGLFLLILTIFFTNFNDPISSLLYLVLLIPLGSILRTNYLHNNPLPLILATSVPSMLVLLMYFSGLGNSHIFHAFIVISVCVYIIHRRSDLQYLLTKERLMINMMNFIISSRFEIIMLIVLYEENLSSKIAVLKLVGVTFALVDLLYGRKLPTLIAQGFYGKDIFKNYSGLCFLMILGIGISYSFLSFHLDLVEVNIKTYLGLSLTMTLSSLVLVRISYDRLSITKYILSGYTVLHGLVLFLSNDFSSIIYSISILNLVLFVVYEVVAKKVSNI